MVCNNGDCLYKPVAIVMLNLYVAINTGCLISPYITFSYFFFSLDTVQNIV